MKIPSIKTDTHNKNRRKRREDNPYGGIAKMNLVPTSLVLHLHYAASLESEPIRMIFHDYPLLPTMTDMLRTPSPCINQPEYVPPHRPLQGWQSEREERLGPLAAFAALGCTVIYRVGKCDFRATARHVGLC